MRFGHNLLGEFLATTKFTPGNKKGSVSVKKKTLKIISLGGAELIKPHSNVFVTRLQILLSENHEDAAASRLLQNEH